MNRLMFELNCILRVRRIRKSLRGVIRASRRLEKARRERKWIEDNPKIHLLNYPYYKIKRMLGLMWDACDTTLKIVVLLSLPYLFLIMLFVVLSFYEYWEGGV